MIRIFSKSKFISLPKAVMCDLDNTLYEYDVPHQKALKAVQDKCINYFSIKATDFKKAFNFSRFQIKKELGKTASSHSRLLYFQRALENLGFGLHISIALDLEQTYWRTFFNQAILFENVKEFLDDLRMLNVPIILVTDLTAQIQFRKLVYFELDKHFDFVVTSEEAGHDKPDQAPFNLALNKLNLKKGDIWMVGDDPYADIEGSKKHINAITLQKKHAGIKFLKGKYQPDAIFNEFKDLRSLLIKLKN
jgi:putative hydrolase of the HAD superfamily